MENSNIRILVTGASGQLGRRLTPRLMESGYKVRAHFRSERRAKEHCPDGAEVVIGNLTESTWQENAVKNCDIVIHGAAKVSVRPQNFDEMREINVEGTRKIIEACIKSGVKKMVHISSVAAVGATDNNLCLDETAPFNLDGYGIPYFETKHEAERLVLSANNDEFEVVAVNPSIMIASPKDDKKNKLNKIPKRLPAYFDFGLNLVQTEDVIEGILLAIKKGMPGERYILAGENIDSKRAFELTEKFFGLKKPMLKIPHSTFPAMGIIAGTLGGIGRRFGIVPDNWEINRQFFKLLKLKFYYSSEKARRELGWKFRPLEKTLDEIAG